MSALSAPVARSQPLVDTMPPPAPQAGVALMAQYDSESDDDNVEAPTPAPVVPAVPAQSLPADFFDRVNSNPTTSKSSSTAATSKIASKIPVGLYITTITVFGLPCVTVCSIRGFYVYLDGFRFL